MSVSSAKAAQAADNHSPRAQEPNPQDSISWHRLTSRKDDFQKILALLVSFDERTGRAKRFSDRETHYLRTAMSVAPSDSLDIYIQDLGGFVYRVTVAMGSAGSYAVTTWIHEDGIRAERDTFANESSHPVHDITCLTDLLAATEPFQPTSDQDFGPHPLFAALTENLNDRS